MSGSRCGSALATVAAGLLALPLKLYGGLRGVEMAFWQSKAKACGTLYVVHGSVRSGYPQAATTCFMQAYAHCHAATLVESFSGVDTSDTYTFAIEPVLFAGGAHACSIQLNDPSGGVFAYGRSNNDWVTCAGVDQRPDGLLFSDCGKSATFVMSTE